MTKAYTLNVLINEVSSLSNSQVSSFYGLAQTLSPRAGTSSRKVQVLNNFVGGQLRSIISGSTTLNVRGTTARARLLSALRNRKNGTLFTV